MIESGTRLGPYEVLAPLGAGGMGEVYRARDTRLDRSVAIKVLPPQLSADADARARFEREAKTISSLNHPHICTLYDVGHQDGLDYLVMEHLEGETLAHRLERGPLPVSDLLRYAVEVSDALDAAHRRGVIHRDLKPGNVMLTKSGAKLLDFGLARTVGLSPTVSNKSDSPTMSKPLTVEGAIVGTFQYMAPEQLEGREADARTDIFAFGSMLYEMTTGKKAFEGRSQASLIAAILERQPAPLSTLAPLAPPALERIVQRCLAKDPDERWQTARDLNHELKWMLDDSSKSGVSSVAKAAATPTRTRPWVRLLLAVLAAVAVVVTGFLAQQAVRNRPPRLNPDMTVRILPLPLMQIGYPGMAQDGKWIALPGADASGRWALYFMNVTGGDAKEVVAADSGQQINYADVSPDGSQIAYSENRANGERIIRVVPSLGGASVEIARDGDAPHWRPDGQRVGYIVLGMIARSGKLELWSVRPDGSDQRQEFVDSLSTGRGRFCFCWSPDARSFAWLRSFGNGSYQELIVRDLKSGRERQLTHDGKSIDEMWWTRQDEIVFSSNRGGSTNLWIIRAAGGPPVRVTKGVGPDIGMRVSADGKTLLYLQRQGVSHLWVGDLATGTAEEVTHEDLDLGTPALSPDSRKIAVAIYDPDPLRRESSLYLMDRDGTHRVRINTGAVSPASVDWSHDGKWICFASRLGVGGSDSTNIYVIHATDPGAPRRIGEGGSAFWVDDTTLQVTQRISSYMVSTRSGARRLVSLDSTLVYPGPSGYAVVVDVRSGREGVWIDRLEEAPLAGRPLPVATAGGASASPAPAARRYLASLSFNPVLFSKGGSYALSCPSPGKLAKLVIASGRREPVAGTYSNLTVGSAGTLGWDGHTFVYLARGVTSKLVLIENLK
jgi:Tol biopolymer transport system component